MKLLILSPNQISRYNWTHQLFRNEFAKHCETVYYGEGYPEYVQGKPISNVIGDRKFDLILTYGLKYTEPFVGIGDVKDIPKAHIAVDYFPANIAGNYERNKKLFDRDKYDIYFGVVGHIVRNLENNGICEKAFLLPFSVDTDIYRKIECDKFFDVFAVFTTSSYVYPHRQNIQSAISKMPGLKKFTEKIAQKRYIQKINESRVCITSNNMFGSLSIKYSEILACGSFLLADKPEDFDELGYIDGTHLVLYKNLNDLKEKIYFYVKNDDIREEIAAKGMAFVRKYHNNTVRVKQFLEIIKKELGIS